MVEPDFPIPRKSKNHKHFLPIGLLKLAAYARDNGAEVRLLRHRTNGYPDQLDPARFSPDEIWVTSLFTYWSGYVKEAITDLKKKCPDSKITVGGIYASLLDQKSIIQQTGCDKVHQGVLKKAERIAPAYDLVERVNGQELDFQILHGSRGCNRRCSFCGTWRIEPKYQPEKSITDLITHPNIVFYDNNFLVNPFVENILNELITKKRCGEIGWCESQSGFDGRILLKNPKYAVLLREAGFRNPRIAWDWEYKGYREIEKQIEILLDAGYPPRDIFIFVLYNWNITFEEMEKKRMKCYEWGVQISDCRYRPLTQLYDHYNPYTKQTQTSDDYYIHEDNGWSDAKVKQFRRNVRQQNICVRQRIRFYSNDFERMKIDKNKIVKANSIADEQKLEQYLQKIGVSYWFPETLRKPTKP